MMKSLAYFLQGLFIKVKKMDVLQQAAKSYQEASEYDYTFWLGTAKRKLTISILSTQPSEFTHVSGLDHLKDIPSVTGSNQSQKRAIFKEILRGKIQYTDIEHSIFLLEEQSRAGQYIFTIKGRIEELCHIKQYLDNAAQGDFYKWDSNRCQHRRLRIPADYVLSVPIDKTKNMYFFLKRKEDLRIKNDRSEPMNLYVFSAFPDSVHLTDGQQKPFTILKLSRTHVKTKTETKLYQNPKYNPEEKRQEAST